MKNPICGLIAFTASYLVVPTLPQTAAAGELRLGVSQEAESGGSDTLTTLHLADSPAEEGATDGNRTPSRQKLAALEEVVVTAQRRAERLIDVPMAVSAISGERLSEVGIGNALELSRAVPSLTVDETGPGRQTISIRGLNTIRGNSSLVGIYLDEMPLSGAQNGFVAAYADLRVIDLERVEVLKGPQGTLFGEGAAGGVVRFITHDPELSRVSGEISTEGSNTADGGWSGKASGTGNLPIVKDVLGVRVAATYEDSSGWIDQPSINRENINDSELWHIRTKALYAPTSQLRIKGSFEIHRNKGDGANIVNQAPYDDGNFLQAVFRDADTGWYDDYEMYNLTATYDFGFAELLSSTSYYSANSDQSFTQLSGAEPNPWIEVLSADFLLDSSNKSQELRLASATSGRFNWTVGAAYKDSETTLSFGESCFDSNFFGGLRQFRHAFCSEYTNKVQEWAGFADASYRLIDRFTIGGGLRYLSGDQEQVVIIPNPYSVEGSADKVTWRAYGKFEAAKDVNLYFNVGTGFRSGGFNQPSQVPLGAPPTYGEEDSIFYEFGAKAGLLDGRVRVDTAFYYGEWQGMQNDFAEVLPAGGILQYTSNDQDSEIKGVEAEVTWAATDKLTLTLAGDVIDAEISWVNPANIAAGYREGDRINGVPDYKFSAGADYEMQWSETVPGSFLLNFSRIGPISGGRLNIGNGLEGYSTDPVNFLNARIGAVWGEWKGALFGTNLLNERGPVSANRLFAAQARPRTVGVFVSKAF